MLVKLFTEYVHGFLQLIYSFLKPYFIEICVTEIHITEIHVSKIRVIQGLGACYRGVEGVLNSPLPIRYTQKQCERLHSNISQ